MKNTFNIEIPELYKLKRSDRERLVLTYFSAFESYPKLMSAFPDRNTRLFALEATLRYYTAYDLKYGSGYSLDKDIHEAVMIIHSDRMDYTFRKHVTAGSYGKGYRAALRGLSKEDRLTRTKLFNELDRLENGVDIAFPHLYIDFLGVAREYQSCGRGKRLMSRICAYADSVDLPLMLFTNTDDDVKFYQSLGFHIIGITHSDEFGFTNTYLQYEPDTQISSM